MKTKCKSLIAVILIFIVGTTSGMFHPSVDTGNVCNNAEANLPSLKTNNPKLRSKNSFENKIDAEVAEKHSKTEYDSLSALSMARFFVKKNNIVKAIVYYEQAIDEEKDKSMKSIYCYELAQVIYVRKDYPKVRSLAHQAITLNPAWGKPYILIGKIYANSAKSIGESDLQQRIVYCLAVDQFIKAKTVDPAMVQEANKEIAQYSQYFPGVDDASFENITAGSSFKIGGWINESTIVRVR